MEQDDEFAFEWYLKAAEQQDVVAQRRVGILYTVYTYVLKKEKDVLDMHR